MFLGYGSIAEKVKTKKNTFVTHLVARFLALVTTMVTKVDHGNQGWLPRLVTMVSYLGY